LTRINLPREHRPIPAPLFLRPFVGKHFAGQVFVSTQGDRTVDPVAGGDAKALKYPAQRPDWTTPQTAPFDHGRSAFTES
jgi:hypothetical protein